MITYVTTPIYVWCIAGDISTFPVGDATATVTPDIFLFVLYCHPPSRGETGGTGRDVHLRLLKKGRWELGESVVCAFHGASWSMGWLGSNVATWRHLVGHHVKVPTLVQLLLLLFLLSVSLLSLFSFLLLLLLLIFFVYLNNSKSFPLT